MPRLQKTKNEYRDGTYANVEGHVDHEKGVFVVTADPDGVIHTYTQPKEKTDIMGENVGEIIKRFTPEYIKHIREKSSELSTG